jgi:hypothetical protein
MKIIVKEFAVEIFVLLPSNTARTPYTSAIVGMCDGRRLTQKTKGCVAVSD